jgi:hypothetical protein
MQYCTKVPLLLNNICRHTLDPLDKYQLTECLEKLECSLSEYKRTAHSKMHARTFPGTAILLADFMHTAQGLANKVYGLLNCLRPSKREIHRIGQ